MSNNPKRLKIFVYLILFLVLAGITAFIAVQITSWQTKKVSPIEKCGSEQPIDHQVVIQYGKVSPAQTDAKRCDRLTILNLDEKSRLVTFGQHDQHIRYDNVEQRLLTSGQKFTVTLDNPGQFRFHDHFDDQIQGTFTVAR